ncbi:hypothetical protein QQZ08_009318 [Neonectria magnoliae]|uniref:Uncharacterized protein n=1 Tax=Neonectria magnoliae TaxID=2732573 RepID=A0ABR1HPY9_9HYPO
MSNEDILNSSFYKGTLAGKTAVATGAGRGIGKALVRDIRLWIDRPTYVLVNNAGIARIDAVVYQHDMVAWSQIMNTNLNGPVALSYQVLPDMVSAGEGIIISIGSRSAIYAMPFSNAHAVAKTGLLRFHENLEHELQGRGIYNYYIVPSNVETSILDTVYAIDEESFRHSERIRQTVYNLNNCEKTSADRVANVCVMLAAEKAAGVLSGRYVDTEGGFGAIWEDIQSGTESRCVMEGLYQLRMDMM